MIDLAPPPLVGFDRPAIVRAGSLDLTPAQRHGIRLRDVAFPLLGTFPGPMVHGARATGAPLTLENLGEHYTRTGATTFTFSAMDIGAETSDRLIIVTASTGRDGGSGSLSSATIGGSAATKNTTSSTDEAISAIFSRVVPTGTTANITLTYSAYCGFGVSINIYALKNYASATPFDAKSNAANASTVSVSVNVPAGGVAIATAEGRGSGYPTFNTLVAVDANQYLKNTGADLVSHASAVDVSAATGLTVTATSTGGAMRRSIAVATWI